MKKGDRIIVILCLLMTVFCVMNSIIAVTVIHSVVLAVFFNVIGLISLLPILPLLNNKQ